LYEFAKKPLQLAISATLLHPKNMPSTAQWDTIRFVN